MTSRWRADDAWTVLARRQDQVVAWHQLREWGWTHDDVRRPVDSGHWRRLEPGVFATTTAPLSARGLVWQGILATRGVACGWTALTLAGLDARGIRRMPHAARLPSGGPDRPPVEIAIEWTRSPGPPRHSRHVHRHRHLAAAIRRGADVPRVRAEFAAAEVCGRLDRDEDAVALVLAVVQQRLCTVDQLRDTLVTARSLPRRALLTEMVTEVADGVTTMLELRWARDVERRHGLPSARRNHDLGGVGAPMIVDAWYEDFDIVVELDGQVAHPRHLAFRDHERDNRNVVAGRVTLRFGWRDVAGAPCRVAAQLIAVLRAAGWTGTPRRCGAGCAVS